MGENAKIDQELLIRWKALPFGLSPLNVRETRDAIKVKRLQL